MKHYVEVPRELQVYRSLRGRRHFTHDDKMAFYSVQQGFVGEKKFSGILKSGLSSDYIALYDILLEHKASLFQIDCLLIFPRQVIMLEVKNYKGEFEFSHDRLYCYSNDKYYLNPLHQLHRSDVHLRELLSKLNPRISLESYLVFVNEEFTLFTDKNPMILLPSQIHPFIRQLNHTSEKIRPQHHTLAEKIKALHIKESPYTRMPEYHDETVRKGVLCLDCRNPMKLFKRKLHCPCCTYQEFVDSGVLRSVIEFTVLFPEEKITTGNIADWCALDLSNRSIRRILQAYLQHHSQDKASYFLFKNQ